MPHPSPASFSLLLAAAQVSVRGSGAGESLMRGTIEIGGANAVGGVLGLLSALLSGPLRAGEPTFIAALGLVFLCCGIGGGGSWPRARCQPRFPALEGTLLPVVICATIVFELGGPVATRMALVHFGELPVRGSRSA